MKMARLSAFGWLDEAENAMLRGLVADEFDVVAGQEFRTEGSARPQLFFLIDGWAMSSLAQAEGSRQIVKVHLAGDVMGGPSLPFAEAVETLTALTSGRIGLIEPAAMGAIFTAMPRLAAIMFMAVQQERVALMDRLAAVGRREARKRVASLLIHLHERLAVLDAIDGTAIELPLTQQHIADILGLTPVHINRTLRQLEQAGLISRSGRRFDLVDLDRLRDYAAVPARALRRDVEWLPAAAS